MKKWMKNKSFTALLCGILLLSLTLTACGNTYVETTGADRVQQVENQGDITRIQDGQEAEANIAAGEMQVHFIDVGHGDATLIISGDHAMLIDAGDASKGTTVQNYIEKCGVRELDYLILTHPDKDHIGGAPVIITKFEIDKVFLSNYEKDSNAYRKLIQALDDKNLEGLTPEVGDRHSLGNAVFTIIAPNRDYSETEKPSNNSSVGILLRHGSNRFLFTGDAEGEAEEDIVKNGIDISADVYQVGHHGGKTSSRQALLDGVKPKYAVISCGEDEKKNPHAKTMNRFRKMGIKIYRTDEQGSIVAVSDGSKISWSCAPSTTW